jgi:hypothetical protein
MTMNSPESMLELHSLVTSDCEKQQAVQIAELMREVGLKCISFNGVCPLLTSSEPQREKLRLTSTQIPRTINCLGAFYNGLPVDVSTAMSKTPTRYVLERLFNTQNE